MKFSSMLNLRDELVNKAYNNNAFVAALGSTNFRSESRGSFQYDNISVTQENNLVTILDHESNESITYNSVDKLVEGFSDTIPGTSLQVSDLYSTASSSGDLYSMLGAITTKFTYCNRLSLGNINSIIDDIPATSSLNYEISDLKNQLLAVTNNDGYITNNTWLITLKDWFTKCKQNSDNESPALDNTAPSTVGALYCVVVNTITTILADIFQALSLVFGGIIAVIGAVITSILNVITRAFETSAKVNLDACNDFLQGTIVAWQENNATWLSIWNKCRDDYSINYCNLQSCGVFFWQGDQVNSIRFNAYLRPHTTPEKVLAKLESLTDDEKADLGISWKWEGEDGYLNNSYLTKSSQNAYEFKPHEADEADLLRMSVDVGYYGACLAVSELCRFINVAPYQHGAWSGAQAWVDQKVWSYMIGTVPNQCKLLCVSMDILRAVHEGRDANYYVSASNVADFMNYYVNYLYTNKDSFTSLLLGSSGSNNGGFLNYPLNPIWQSCYSSTNFFLDGAGVVWKYNSNYTISVDEYSAWVIQPVNPTTYYKADCLPIDYMCECTGIITEQATKLLVLSALAATSIAFVSSKLSRALRRKKIKKDVKRAQDISNAKDAWLANPNDTEALNNYVKKVDKYNRMGKLFGWGSYDAGNEWFDRPTGGDDTPKSNRQVADVKNTLNTMTGTGSSQVSLPEIKTLLLQIKDLIK